MLTKFDLSSGLFGKGLFNKTYLVVTLFTLGKNELLI